MTDGCEKKKVSRNRLSQLQGIINGNCSRSDRTVYLYPPPLGRYRSEESRKLPVDVEIYTTFFDLPVRPVMREIGDFKYPVLGIDDIRYREEEVWVTEFQGSEGEGQWGIVNLQGQFVPRAIWQLVPSYTKKIEDALSLKCSLMALGYKLFLEGDEGTNENSFTPTWNAKIASLAGETVGEGTHDECAIAIVLAVIDSLLSKENASWRVTVTD